jgi:hypothetical protein
MSQGIKWNKDEVMTALEPYFKLGCNVTKACDYAGVPRTTVQTWIEDDETLRLKVNAWQNEVNTAARRALYAAITNGDQRSALEWLSRKEKDEFSTRTETTGKDGEAVVLAISGMQIVLDKQPPAV